MHMGILSRFYHIWDDTHLILYVPGKKASSLRRWIIKAKITNQSKESWYQSQDINGHQTPVTI